MTFRKLAALAALILTFGANSAFAFSRTMCPTSAEGTPTVQGRAGNSYTASSGKYTVTDMADATSMLHNGWYFCDQRNGGPIFYQNATSVAVGQTLNTYGAITTISPDSGAISMLPLSWDIVFGGTFGSETVTVSVTANYTDGTATTIATYTATSTGTTAFTNAQLRAQFGVDDNVGITSITVKAKSSLSAGGSTATVAINAHGLNFMQ